MLRDRIDYQEFCRAGQLRRKSCSAGPSRVAARRALLGIHCQVLEKFLFPLEMNYQSRIFSDTIAGEIIMPFPRNGRSQLP